jgi:hypothetical protein
MKTRTLMLTLAVCFAGAAVCLAQDPNIGTWKLNEAKSHMPPQVSKNSTVVFEAVGDNVKVTQDATDKDGKPIRMEWTGKFDGKDYPVTGNPALDCGRTRRLTIVRWCQPARRTAKLLQVLAVSSRRTARRARCT